MRIIDSTAVARDCRVAIVASRSRYNSFVVDRLLEGCTRTLRSRDVPDLNVTLVRVPGAFEIPAAVRAIADRGTADAVIALGAVIRGETAHFEYIAGECARGLSAIAAATGLPVIFGVLTVDNAQQALDRSGEDESNKGSEAAAAALDMIGVMRGIRA
jgi:6,7-dimethyl-8-ribityllumazine synthase